MVHLKRNFLLEALHFEKMDAKYDCCYFQTQNPTIAKYLFLVLVLLVNINQDF